MKLPVDAEVVVAEPECELRWIGPARPQLRRVASGNHYHRLEDFGDGTVRLHHGEDFAGWLIPNHWAHGQDLLQHTYERFNRALLRRVQHIG